MLWKVLKNNIKKGQILGVFLGIYFGLLILMGAFCFYLDVKPIFEDKSGFWKDEYIIINKKIFLSNTLSQFQSSNSKIPTFSDEEIEDLKKQKNVKDIAKFSVCSFKISAYSDNEDFLPYFRTDLFFEAVPNNFIDINSKFWAWNQDTNFVPVIIPKAYLNLYNFGFAQSQNLPQISEDAITAINLKLNIRGNGKHQTFQTRIIGFSERINTILVPKTFVDWANSEFGSQTNPNPGRLIIVVNDPANKDFFDFLEQHNYDVNKSEINNSKALAFMKIIISVIMVIGIIIVIMAFSIMIVSIQLLLQRNSGNIKKLNNLGFSLKEITKPYHIFIIILFAIIFLLSIISVFLLRTLYLKNISLFGYQTNFIEIIPVIIIGFVFVGIIIALLTLMTTRNVKTILK
ncbi:MAG: hypothetical protein LBV69_07460 [Bacteroidales bacterium]|jgi:hypothetical protein|nr:hypothetical protein [Bacteroidales bacterium]